MFERFKKEKEPDPVLEDIKTIAESQPKTIEETNEPDYEQIAELEGAISRLILELEIKTKGTVDKLKTLSEAELGKIKNSVSEYISEHPTLGLLDSARALGPTGIAIMAIAEMGFDIPRNKAGIIAAGLSTAFVALANILDWHGKNKVKKVLEDMENNSDNV